LHIDARLPTCIFQITPRPLRSYRVAYLSSSHHALMPPPRSWPLTRFPTDSHRAYSRRRLPRISWVRAQAPPPSHSVAAHRAYSQRQGSRPYAGPLPPVLTGRRSAAPAPLCLLFPYRGQLWRQQISVVPIVVVPISILPIARRWRATIVVDVRIAGRRANCRKMEDDNCCYCCANCRKTATDNFCVATGRERSCRKCASTFSVLLLCQLKIFEMHVPVEDV
jgi:hypothetical protein